MRAALVLFSFPTLAACGNLPTEPACRISTDVQVIDVDPVTLLPRVRCIDQEGLPRLLSF
jgi:hypothetical protein